MKNRPQKPLLRADETRLLKRKKAVTTAGAITTAATAETTARRAAAARQPRHPRPSSAEHKAMVSDSTAMTIEVTGMIGATAVTGLHSRRSPICFAKARRFSSRSRKSRSHAKVRASRRTSRCRADIWFTCRRSSISAFRERSNRRANAAVCEL